MHLENSAVSTPDEPDDDAVSTCSCDFISPAIKTRPVYSYAVYTRVLPPSGLFRMKTVVPKQRKLNHPHDDDYMNTYEHKRHILNKLRAVQNFFEGGEDRTATTISSAIADSQEEDIPITSTRALVDAELELLTTDGDIDWQQDIEDDLFNISGDKLPIHGGRIPGFTKLFVFNANTVQVTTDGDVPSTLKAMYDSGASGNFMAQSAATRLNLERRHCAPLQVRVANNKVIVCTEVVYVPIEIGKYKAVVPAHVLPNDMEIDLILGTAWQDTLHKGRVWTSSRDHTVSFGYNRKVHTIQCIGRPTPQPEDLENNFFEMISAEQAANDMKHWTCTEEERLSTWQESDFRFAQEYGDANGVIPGCFIVAKLSNDLIQLAQRIASKKQQCDSIALLHQQDLDEAEQVYKVAREGSFEIRDKDNKAASCNEETPYENMEKEIQQLLSEFEAVFSEDLEPFNPLGKEVHHAIPIKAGCEHERPYRRPIKMGMREREALAKQLNELIEKGYIRPSSSAYGAPAFMVPKPHQPDKLRCVVEVIR